MTSVPSLEKVLTSSSILYMKFVDCCEPHFFKITLFQFFQKFSKMALKKFESRHSTGLTKSIL